MDNPIDEDITTDVDDIRKILDLMEGKSVEIGWDENAYRESNNKIYDISVEKQYFSLEQNNLFFLLGFYGFKSFYHNNNDDDCDSSTTIQIPKLYYKDNELKRLLKDLYTQRAFWSYKKGEDIIGNINSIMRKRYDNMKTLYYAHPMKTYNTNIEKEGLNIIEREIGNKLPLSIKEVVNPNSDKYRWKGEHDMHETEDWGSGFSWSKFAESMPHYCNLVYNSDGVIYLPIFDFNRRKNARRKFTRKIKRGMKTEISYCTKLGDPLITFTDPNDNMLPTDIRLPLYMIDHIRGRITRYGNENSGIEKIINTIDNNDIGMIEGNIIKDVNNNMIAKIVKFAYVICDKCKVNASIPINGIDDENELREFCNSPHGGGCGGKISSYEHDSIVDLKNNTVGRISIETDFMTSPFTQMKYVLYGTFKGELYSTYNSSKDENSGRYNSPYPFHMYINKKTNEIHEKPEDAGSLGGDVIPFEPWTKLSS